MVKATREIFEILLHALDDDLDRASLKYEMMRRKTEKFFFFRGCYHYQECADIAIDRLAARLSEGEEITNITSYLNRISSLVLKEYQRKQFKELSSTAKVERISDNADPEAELIVKEEQEHQERCLDECLGSLPTDKRYLFTTYFNITNASRGRIRKRLAIELHMTFGALRIQASRLRRNLELCILDCLKRLGSAHI
jgi:DNA-directed RNA polymerase specialized sigma24 family protein